MWASSCFVCVILVRSRLSKKELKKTVRGNQLLVGSLALQNLPSLYDDYPSEVAQVQFNRTAADEHDVGAAKESNPFCGRR